MGQGGIMPIGYWPGAKNVNRQNQILNNHIHHCGLIYWHSVWLMMWKSGENHVANYYIHHMPRHAISLSGFRVPYFEQRCESPEICGSLRRPEIGNRKTWDEVMPFMRTKNNLVEYNEVELGVGAGISVGAQGCQQHHQ